MTVGEFLRTVGKGTNASVRVGGKTLTAKGYESREMGGLKVLRHKGGESEFLIELEGDE